MTDGRRIYAIGDIHGCLPQLETVCQDIARDLERRPHPAPLLICLGDYVDRGPDSAGVLSFLAEQVDDGPIETRLIIGNHDVLLLDYLEDPKRPNGTPFHWLEPELGGDRTLASYGVSGRSLFGDRRYAEFVKVFPDRHAQLLTSASLTERLGQYLFVHAGIRPGIPLEEQSREDLIWIRSPFLESVSDHGVIVVHGHTPVSAVENHGNRIAVDTGAVFGGVLSCLVLEDRDQNLLVGDNLFPLPQIAA